MGDVLRVSLIQTDIVWEDKRANLDKYATILSHITGDCDLVVFPEMFTTGFSMRAEDLAEYRWRNYYRGKEMVSKL